MNRNFRKRCECDGYHGRNDSCSEVTCQQCKEKFCIYGQENEWNEFFFIVVKKMNGMNFVLSNVLCSMLWSD